MGGVDSAEAAIEMMIAGASRLVLNHALSLILMLVQPSSKIRQVVDRYGINTLENFRKHVRYPL